MKVFQFAVILSSLIIFSSFQFSYAQYTGTGEIYDNQSWSDKVELLLQDHLETKLMPNQNIINDTIKTRISGSPEDVLPPRYHIRIIYDLLENNKIKHMDLVYKVDFGEYARTPDNAKLEKLYENVYLAPNQIKHKKFEEFESYLTGMLQNIMCRQGFDKIIKSSDNSPACVKPESIPKLIERSWAGLNNFESFVADFGEKGIFEIRYSLEGGTISSVSEDLEAVSLIVITNSEKNGKFSLVLSEEFVDSLYNDDGVEYFIFLNGEEIQVVNFLTPNKILNMTLEKGLNEIEIIGPFVPR